MIINGPPADEKCRCCGRHISELEPFKKPEEGEDEDFFLFEDGEEFLFKNFRPGYPYDPEAEMAVREAEKHLADAGYKDKNPLQWMKEKYGKEKGKNLYLSYMAYTQIISSWECKDCLGLGLDEYWEKYYKSLT
jgi:hypothetical protein